MEGLPELLFVAIFILFTLVEGIGRKKKAERKRQEEASRTSGPGEESRTPEREGATSPSPSGTVDLGKKHRTSSVGRSGSGEKDEEGSSEGLVPEEIWDEILGLARGSGGEGKERERKEPRGDVIKDREEVGVAGDVESLEEIPDFEARSLEPLEPRDSETEGGVQTPKRSRETIPALDKPVPRGATSVPRGRVSVAGGSPRGETRASGAGRSLRRELFGGGSPKDLQKGIILLEVLGPPVGMRE